MVAAAANELRHRAKMVYDTRSFDAIPGCDINICEDKGPVRKEDAAELFAWRQLLQAELSEAERVPAKVAQFPRAVKLVRLEYNSPLRQFLAEMGWNIRALPCWQLACCLIHYRLRRQSRCSTTRRNALSGSLLPRPWQECFKIISPWVKR